MNFSNGFQKTCAIIRSPYFAAVWFSAMALSYFFIDQKLACYLNARPYPALREFAGIATDFAKGKYYLVSLPLLFIVFRYLWRRPMAAMKVQYLFTTVLTASLVTLSLKLLLGRARPNKLFHSDMYGFYFLEYVRDMDPAMWSFPSGHATTIAAVMVGLSFVFKRLWSVFFCAMLMIAFTRLILTAHYLSDVMLGLYIGAMSAIMIAEYFFKPIRTAVNDVSYRRVHDSNNLIGKS